MTGVRGVWLGLRVTDFIPAAIGQSVSPPPPRTQQAQRAAGDTQSIMQHASERQPALSGRDKVKYSAVNVEDDDKTNNTSSSGSGSHEYSSSALEQVQGRDEDGDGTGTGEEEESEIFNLDDSSSTEEKVQMIVVCSVPIIFTFLLSVFGTSIMMYFAGKLSKEEDDANIFAGVSLGLTYCNISFLSIMEGFSSAVETLSSNYNGSKNYSAVGQTLHKSIVSLSLVALPLLFSWFFVHKIFRMLSVSEELSDIASEFLLARICAAPLEICMMSYMKYLQSMGIMNPGMYSGMCYNVVLAVLCYLSVHVWHFSFVSLAWCHVASVVTEIVLLVALTHNKKEVRRTMVAPTLDSLLAVGDFLVFGFSGCVMMCAEWWAFELLTIFASMVSAKALSSQTIMLQAITILFMFPLGIGISTGAIVGNALGAGHKQLAISIGYISLAVIFVIDLVLCPLIFHFRLDFVELFTSDADVIYTCVHQCLPLMAVEIFIDGAQAVSSGVLRGAGKQDLGAAVNIGAYYLLALPIAWYLCFIRGYEVLGLMIGVCVGVFTQTATLCCFIVCRASYIFEGLAIDGLKMGGSAADVENSHKKNEKREGGCHDHGHSASLSSLLSFSPPSSARLLSPHSSPNSLHAHHHLGSPHRRPLSMDGVVS